GDGTAGQPDRGGAGGVRPGADLDATMAELAGRGVEFERYDQPGIRTDERGVFDAGHRRGKQVLVLRGPGMIPKQVEVDLGSGKGAGVDLELELEAAAGRFEGRVVDGNNQPIANVEVELRPLDGLSPSVITWTDDRGLYQFDQLAPGPVEIGFAHGDYVPNEARAKIDEQGGLRHEVTLETGWSAAVLVRSAGGGQPIAGAQLRATTDRGKGPLVTATTDKQGLAQLDRLLGGAVELEVVAPGWVVHQQSLREDPSGTASVTIELIEGGSISGTIDDDIGDPVSNATIEIRTTGGDLLAETKSNGRGEWRVDGIPAGDVVVRAEAPPALSAVLAPITVDSDVIRGEVTTAVRLRFERP
ncbi:MAG TPA: carboxypeptidase-like regulatory domain-containing protein, partial [Enhygromyxa sp.]|nr:carboxypeptidase-like regulatory domain-containing protein [Enhygromyxa sp.]